jgi:RNA polymerase sigma-70 factor (ECF subfamily)
MKDPPGREESMLKRAARREAEPTAAAPAPMSEAELAAALRAGDPEAAHEFYDRFAPRILRFIRHALPSGAESDAEDLLQETFMALADALPYFRGQSSLFTFACAIAHRKVASFIRTGARRARLAPALAPPEPSPAADPDVTRALAALSPEYRAVLILKYVDDASVDEIARIVGASEHAVESRLARARRALKKLLEGP